MSGPASQPTDRAECHPGEATFARAWAQTLRRTCYVPMRRAERHQFLTRLTHQLRNALTCEASDPTAGYWVGSQLVAAGFSAPEALSHTLAAVHTRLLADLDLTDPAVGSRLTRLVEMLAAGFASAVRDRTLSEQDSIRLAALTARDQAEQALRAAERRFRHLAWHDALTGLPNRTQFTHRLQTAITTATAGERLGVCCLDLDGFDAINDSLGHQVGDQMLTAVAGRLDAVATAAGHPLARLDSDKFAILVAPTTCPDDAAKVADRALTAVAGPFHLDGQELAVTASAGVAERPAAGADAADLIRAADIAMHWSKTDGKARWTLYDEDRSVRDKARYQLSAAMPAALRRGQFRLVYQPLVGLADGRLAGVEALVRWDHPDHGELGADRFIGLAEHTGLIVPLGTYLLDQACRQAAAWACLTEDPPYVSVNIAARQLTRPGLVATVLDLLDRVQLDPGLLQLELTERAAISIDSESTATLHQLACLGVRVVLDDFGTGYANLDCLRTLPLHGIKLDGSFIPPADRDPSFVRTIVQFAHGRGLQVTAEGIETAGQARALRTVGCDIGQGWHFGRPVRPRIITDQLLG